MKKILTAIICIFLSCGFAHGQSVVRGLVMDTLNYMPLRMSSVVLLRAADSVIENYGRTGDDGKFELSVPKEGRYIIRAAFHGFADYVDRITINKPVTDLGVIPMLSKEHILKEFVLTRQIAAIKIKGDTTEYVADSFKTKENATVEDLLKKLPGIQVDKNGQIVAQGETVAKILVDGEEFFSDDPKVVTKGLQAKAVDKVQVFDKKSDQAEFTGIDDGQKIKTINLELKEEYKKGYFGKVDAGGGTDGYFQDQAMINAFKSKRQISAFGIVSNTDKVGLGWQDNEKYSSGGGNTEITEDGQMMITYGNDGANNDFGGWNGKYNGEGLPKTWTGGLHYADKWNDGKEHLGANYRYAMQNVEVNGSTTVQNGNNYTQETSKMQFSKGDRQAVDGVFDWKLDSVTTLKLTANAGLKDVETSSVYDGKGENDAKDSITYNHRNITSKSNSQFFDADLLFRKKFAKKGRTLSVDVKENDKGSGSTGYLNSTSYSNLSPLLFNVNQRKENTSTTLAFSAKATYTEPITNEIFMEVNYGITLNNSYAKNFSFDTTNGSDRIDSLLSSEYRYNVFTNKGGLNFKYNKKKINFAIGLDVSQAQYVQTDLVRHDSSRNTSYTNYFPSASFNYKIGKQTSFNIYYQGSTRQPTISQIQPLTQNTDPLNITIGNPGLRQEFTHQINGRFNDYKVLSSRYTWASFGFTSTSDAISTSQKIVNGVDTTKYINVNGNYSGYVYYGGGFKISKTDLFLGWQISGALSHVNNYINSQTNTSDNNSYTIGPYINYEKEGKFEFNLNPSFSYHYNKASVGQFSSPYKIFTTEFSGNVTLPEKFEVGTSVDVMIRERTDVFTTNNNVIKWNAYVSKKLLKKSQLEIRASLFDLLNQNIGYDRSAPNGIITENRYNTIRRYGMLNLIWNFTKTPSGAAPQTEGNLMIK